VGRASLPVDFDLCLTKLGNELLGAVSMLEHGLVPLENQPRLCHRSWTRIRGEGQVGSRRFDGADPRQLGVGRGKAICKLLAGCDRIVAGQEVRVRSRQCVQIARQSPAEGALAIREKILGAEHPDTAAGPNNLAGHFQARGQLAQAEPLYVRSLAIHENALGIHHPITFRTLVNYLIVLSRRGRRTELRTVLGRLEPDRAALARKELKKRGL
jgi:hypothetical protein